MPHCPLPGAEEKPRHEAANADELRASLFRELPNRGQPDAQACCQICGTDAECRHDREEGKGLQHSDRDRQQDQACCLPNVLRFSRGAS
jgi:hypothetical protein